MVFKTFWRQRNYGIIKLLGNLSSIPCISNFHISYFHSTGKINSYTTTTTCQYTDITTCSNNESADILSPVYTTIILGTAPIKMSTRASCSWRHSSPKRQLESWWHHLTTQHLCFYVVFHILFLSFWQVARLPPWSATTANFSTPFLLAFWKVLTLLIYLLQWNWSILNAR